MKIAYFYTSKTKGQDLLWGLVKNGHKIEIYTKDSNAYDRGETFEKERALIEEFIKARMCDCAMSWNFFPAVSDACMKLGIPYVSWIFDSPLLHIYCKEALNSCNYVFSLDRVETEELRSKGIKAFHLPMGVNTDRLNALDIKDEQIAEYSGDVAFVGSLYQNNPYNLLALPGDVKEKYDALFGRQLGDWTRNYLYEEFGPEDEEIFAKYAYGRINGIQDYELISPKYLYCGLMMSRRMAEIERAYILNTLAEDFNVTLYNSADDHSVLNGVECRPAVAYETIAPIVYFSTKINLNFTLKSIQTGIPLRVFDISAVGGFVMSNYQEEFEECYKPGQDIETFRTLDELVDKTRFYLTHERERLIIAMNGYRRTCAEHTMNQRVAKIFDIMKQE